MTYREPAFKCESCARKLTSQKLTPAQTTVVKKIVAIGVLFVVSAAMIIVGSWIYRNDWLPTGAQVALGCSEGLLVLFVGIVIGIAFDDGDL